MDLSGFDGKYVYIRDRDGDTFSGIADYEGRDFLECEYGGTADKALYESKKVRGTCAVIEMDH